MAFGFWREKATSALSAEFDPITMDVDTARSILAPFLVIDAIAIADTQPFTGAVAPDRVLNVAREGFWKAGVELSGIDALAQHRQ